MEAALAHAVRNQTEAAYARSDLFERRRHLMEDWGEYLEVVRGQVGRPAPRVTLGCRFHPLVACATLAVMLDTHIRAVTVGPARNPGQHH